jgi:hypothetical protein
VSDTVWPRSLSRIYFLVTCQATDLLAAINKKQKTSDEAHGLRQNKSCLFVKLHQAGVYVPAEVLAEIDTYLRVVLPDRY